jgi:hypothetical protein
MINPLLTVLFDFFLIGSAAAILAGMAREYFVSRTPSVGSPRTGRPALKTADADRLRFGDSTHAAIARRASRVA